MIYSLVYVSYTTALPTSDQLAEMLEIFRSRNALLQVTGLLLYSQGSYMQVLEGQETTVLRLYRRISQDHRHHAVTTLLRGPRHAREFPDWTMAFHDFDHTELRASPGFSPFLENRDLHSFTTQPDGSSRARILLESFRKGLLR